MPVLSNPRHERFAQELAKGKSGTEAYKLAGYKPDATGGAASRLLGNVRVADRVTELKERSAQRVEVTLASLIEEAEQARRLAMSIDQPAAAIAAVKEKGVLSGVRVEKSERRNINDARELSDDELDAAIAEASAREEAAAGRSGLTH